MPPYAPSEQESTIQSLGHFQKRPGSQQVKWVYDWAWVHMTQRRTETGGDGAVGNMSV